MTVFLVSLFEYPLQTARRQLAESDADVEVIRTWDSPRVDVDFLLVRAADTDILRGAVESADLPVRGVQPLTVGGEDIALPEAQEILPQDLPDSLSDIDPVGWVDPPLVWCDRCKTWHEQDKHVQ